jgi:hypothetical protein
VILDGTTVREVEKYHAETVGHIVEKTNADAELTENQDRRQREADQSSRQDHVEHVREVTERVRVDAG